jgi:hypothetical protein
MSVEKSRSSLLAIEVESTVGTYVPPASATHFIALQEGFKFAPNFQTLENAELRASIGVPQPIQGLEQPTGSFAHYFRASGTAGTAPNYGKLLKSIMGAETANGTERTTTSSSSVSVVKLGAGGSDFARGFGALVKNAVYEYRNVHSVSTNDLTLGFNLATAPGSGVGVGKCVNYSPANTGHPSLSLTCYRGNGGAVEAISGCFVNQVDLKFQAGQLVGASFQVDGVKFHLNPVVVTASTSKIDFTDDTGTAAGTLTVGTYRDPYEFAAHVQSVLTAANTAKAKTVTYNKATGTYKIVSAGTVLSLLWNTGTNTANSAAALLGFSTAADNTGTAAGTGYTGAAVSQAAALTPSYDNADPQAAKANEVLIGDSTDTTVFSASSVNATITNQIENVEDVCADSGVREKFINKRTISVKIVGVLKRYDVDLFYRYRSNADVRMAYTGGSKSGGNWVEGTIFNFYVPVAKVSAHELGDNNGLVTVEVTVSPYVDSSGNGEFYLNFN